MSDDPTADTVKRKAADLDRERGRKPALFAHLVHVGVLGWVFILPVIALAWLGHVAHERTGQLWPAVAGVVAGIALGAYLVWRNVRAELARGGSGPIDPPGA